MLWSMGSQRARHDRTTSPAAVPIHRAPEASPSTRTPQARHCPPPPLQLIISIPDGTQARFLHLRDSDGFPPCSSAEITTFCHENSSSFTFRQRKISAGGRPRHGEHRPPSERAADSGTRRCALVAAVDFNTEEELNTWPADVCVHRCACERAPCRGVSQARTALKALTVPLV